MKINPLYPFEATMRHPILTALFILIVTAVMGLGLLRINLDTSLDSLLPAGDPMQAELDKITAVFGSNDTTIIYIKHPQLFSYEPLKKLEDLHYYLSDSPLAAKVDSLYTMKSIRGQGGSVDSSTILSEPTSDQAALAKAKENAIYSPFIHHNFINDDGTATAITLTEVDNPNDPVQYLKTYNLLEKGLTPFKADKRFEVFHIGSPRLRHDLSELLVQDISNLLPMSFLLLLVSLAFLLRRVSGVFLPMISACLSITWTLGLMGWIGLSVNVLTAMLPTLLIVMGTSEVVHLFSTYLDGLKNQTKQPYKRREAVAYMVEHGGLGIYLTILTTMVGFVSNLTSPVMFIWSFACAASIGMAFSGLLSIILPPLFLNFFGAKSLPAKVQKRLTEHKDSVLDHVAVFLTHFCIRYSRYIIGVTIILSIILTAYASQLKVNNDPLSYLKPSNPILKEIDELTHELAGMQTIFVAVEAPYKDAFKEPANLDKLTQITAMIKTHDKFDVAISLADQFALINREMNNGDPTAFHVPKERAAVDELLLFFQASDLQNYMSPDFKMANILVRHHIRNSSELLEGVDQIQAQAEKIMGSDFKVIIASKNLMINRAASSLMSNMIVALPFEVLVIFILVSLFFNNFAVGLLTLVPKLIPVAFIFGIMVLWGTSLNPGTIMVAMIGIGIAVAETVHMFVTFNQMWRLHDSKSEALKVTMKKEIVPALTTCTSLILGFLVLIFSNFELVSEFGILCAVSIFIALLCDLLVTPTLIAVVRVTSFFDIISLKLQKRVMEESPLFAGIRPYQVRKAVLLCHAERYKPNEQIIHQGKIERKMYLILEGTVEVSVTHNGVKSVLAILKPGEVFGEIGYLHEVKRTADVYALDHTELMTFNQESLTRNMRIMPRTSLKMNMNICKILGQRLIEANAKVL